MTDPARPVFVVAPDKFKGTLTAPEAAEAIAAGIRSAVPDAEVRLRPMADGGDGTVDAVLAAGGELRTADVPGPLGSPVTARWALLGRTAVIESAEACGLALVSPTPTTALDATTNGVGCLVLAALDAGARRIVIGLGGSASTDGGAGALRALGARTLAADGSPVAGGGGTLGDIATLDLAGLDPRIRSTEIVLASDVANPMAGPLGAARVFAAQKGADAAGIDALDRGLASWTGVLRAATGVDLERAGSGGGAWGGAAGGLGGGLCAALGARPVPGTDELAELTGFDAALEGAALLVVGEGSMDRQTELGKAPVALARRARDRGIRVLAIAGRTDLDATALAADGIAWIVSAASWAGSDAAARADAAHWVTEATRRSVAGEAAPQARPSPVPVAPTPYFHFLRTPRNRWWRSLLLIVSLVGAFVLVSVVAGLVASVVDLVTGRSTLEGLAQAAQKNNIVVTPAIFLANNLALASLIPAAYLLQWAITRQRPRWLSSVVGGIRWRWVALATLVVLPLWLVYIVGDALLTGGFSAAKFTGDTWFLLISVLLTTPLQSAGEEIAFRGALTRAVASWIPRRWVAWTVGTLVSSVVFMLAHSAGDWWLNAFYLSFGVGLSALAWATGGLEAGIVIHAVNNTLAFIPTILFGDITKVFDRQSGAGDWTVLIGVAAVILVGVVLVALARRRGVARLGPPGAPLGGVPSPG